MAPKPGDSSGSDKGAIERKLSEIAPQVQSLINQAKPLLEKVEPFIRQAYPYCVQAQSKGAEIWCLLKPYYDEEMAEIGLAVVLLFLGGHFAMSIACWQVFRVSGYRLMGKSWLEMKDGFKEAMIVLQKDPEAKALFDQDGDNVIQPSELLIGLKDLAIAKTGGTTLAGIHVSGCASQGSGMVPSTGLQQSC